MLRCPVGFASAARAIPVIALLLAVVGGAGCIGGSTPYPPAVTGDVDAGGTRGTDGGVRDAASPADFGAPADLGPDPAAISDGSTAADGASPDGDLPDADVADAGVADADTADADSLDAEVADADALDADR